VDVVESPPAIDPVQISSKEELTGAELIDIPYPGPNDYHDALTFIPGVTQDGFGQAHVGGGEIWQTLTLLDGFNVTNQRTASCCCRPASTRSAPSRSLRAASPLNLAKVPAAFSA
jgi:hypothetical protein